MTKEEAEALVPGQKIKYRDGRIATVITAAAPPPTPPVLLEAELGVMARVGPPGVEMLEVAISFDDDPQDPKPVCYILSTNFPGADPI